MSIFPLTLERSLLYKLCIRFSSMHEAPLSAYLFCILALSLVYKRRVAGCDRRFQFFGRNLHLALCTVASGMATSKWHSHGNEYINATLANTLRCGEGSVQRSAVQMHTPLPWDQSAPLQASAQSYTQSYPQSYPTVLPPVLPHSPTPSPEEKLSPRLYVQK